MAVSQVKNPELHKEIINVLHNDGEGGSFEEVIRQLQISCV
jgi:hypothetical protein